MRHSLVASILLAMIAFAAVALVVMLLPAGADAAPTYINSDWDINNGDVVTRANEEIILTGNLTVKDGGLLTLRNVTLRLNSSSSQMYHIEVEDGGRLNIYDGDGSSSSTADASLITANDTTYNFAFRVRNGGELFFNDSALSECGVSAPLEDSGLYLASTACYVREVTISDGNYGIIADSASPTVEDCTIEDMTGYGVYLYTSSTDVLRCTIDNTYRGVIAYYAYPSVTDTDITTTTSDGIYVWNGEADISGCTITDSGRAGIYTNYNTVYVSGCTLSDHNNYGILSSYSTVTVTGTEVDDTGTGIYLYRTAAGSSVTGGKVTNCTFNGIYAYLTSADIDGTNVFDMTTNGIYLNSWSGTVRDTYVETTSVGYYVRSSTGTLYDVAVDGATTHGISVSGGSPTIEGFDVRGSATGLNVESSGALAAYDGTISGSTTRDVNVASGGVADLTSSSFTAGSVQVQGAGSALNVHWYVDLHGVWQDGSDVDAGAYTVTDRASSTVASGTLDGTGWATGLRIRQYQVTPSGTTNDTPHTFTVSKGGLSGLAAATVDADIQVTVTVSDNVPPSGYSMNAEPVFTQGTTNAVSWTAGSDTGVGGMEYYCEMATDAGFASVVYGSGWTSSLTFTFIGLVDGTTYHYHVRARDAVGNVGAWSAGVSSTQDSSPPSVPVVVGEPAYTQGTSNTVTWGTSTDGGIGGVTYQTQYTDDPTFDTVLATTAWQATTSRTYSGLTDGTTYLYRVRARDAFGQTSAWSSPVSSTQDSSPPATPNSASLPTYTKGLSVTFQWLATPDSGVGGVEYYAEYDSQSWFPSPDGSSGWTTSLEHTFNGLPENTWHFFHVRARDALGQASGWSAITWTRNDNTAPTTPVISVEPAYTPGNENTVSWSASSDGAGAGGIEYWVETDTSAAFTSPDFTSGWQTARSYTFSSLAGGQTYHYRVKARDALANEGSFSAIQSSTQDDSPPPAPTMATEPAFTQGTSNTVGWTAVTDDSGGTVSYRVLASLSSVFATTEGDSGWRTSTSWTFSGLSDGSTYYYRVKARDQFNQEGPWSNIVGSTQDASPPTGYYMLAEPLYTQGTSNTVGWNPGTDSGSGGVEYQVEVWTLATTAWIQGTSYTFTGLPENTYVYYRVRARDAVGNVGGWSSWIYSRQDASPPAVPSISSLPSWSQGTSVTVAWGASSDGAGIGQVTYKTQYAASATFSPVLGESLWQSERTYTFSGLTDGQAYYFRVRAKDGLDQESGWSSWVSTTMDSQAPPAPFLASEPEYTAGTSNILSWTSVTDTGIGGVEYEVQASTVPTFASLAGTSGWISGTSHTFTGLSDGTLYYYRAHARDGLRQVGPWSNVERSTQDATAPAAPVITAEPWYTPGTENTIYWSKVTDSASGGVQYYVEYDNDWRFGSPNGNSGWVTDTEHTFTGLAENVWWYYHVRARDAVGNVGAWSGITFSRQDDTAPSVPAMSAEPAYTAGTTNTVGWSASSDGSGAGGVTYSAEMALTNTFSTVLATSPWTSQTSWTFTGLSDGLTYYYRVRARDAVDHVSSYSNVVFSTQDASAPSAPFMTAEPAFTAGTANTIAWTAVVDGGVGGVEYEAHRSTSPAFTSVVSSGWLRGTSYSFTGLSDGTTYYYRAHARDSFGQVGGWSNVERSTQDASAPTVPGLEAEPTYTEGTSNTLYWTASTDAGVGGVEYWIEYDSDFFFRSPDGNSGWITATQFTFDGLAENTWWFYRVRARDAFGYASGWSTTRWSRQDASAPTVPGMRIEPSYTPGTSNTVSWTSSTDAGVGGVQYQAYCGVDATLATPIYSSGWTTSLSHTFAGLVDGVTYYYAVQSRDAFDHRSALSNVVSSTQDNAPPATPTMALEPEYTQGTSNGVAWSAAEDAGVGGVVYTLQWSTSSVFSSVTGEYDRLTGTSAVVTGLADGTRYYYRVRARDAFSYTTPWSNVVWSIQDASAPPVPSMKAEPEFTKGTENTVYWSPVTDTGVGGVEYYTEISTDGAFTNPIGSGWTTSTELTWGNLGDGSRYWYRVRARDAFGQTSAWSAFVSSTQDDRAPPVPTLAALPTVSPGTTRSVSWNAVTDAGVGGVEYEVQCSLIDSFATLHGTSGWTSATSHTFSGLSDGSRYSYRVRSRDAFDHRSGWSGIRSSVQDASPPSTPSMAAEPQFTAGTSNTVTWSPSVDAGVGGVQYYLEVATDGAFSDVVGTYGWASGTSASFTGLSDGVTYYYRVRARDAYGYASPWSSAVWSTQDASPPSVPRLDPEPTFTPGTTNTLTWSLSIDTGIGGVEYWIEWDNDPGFGSVNDVSNWVPVREWTFSGLPELQRIFYRVRARDALGQTSFWSQPVNSIQDDSPPSNPSLNELPEFTKGRSVAVSWNPAVDLGVAGVQYWCEWDEDPSFATPGGSSGWVASATHTFGGLPEHVRLHFRVRARDAFWHLTEWAGGQATTLDASPPSVPYLATEPLYTQGTNNGLEWSTSVDLGVGSVEYKLQGTSDATWAVVDKDSGWLRGTSHTFAGLSDGATYYYRVQARDAFAWETAWSPVVSSTQDASPPGVPFPDPMPTYTRGTENTMHWSTVLDAGVGGVTYMAEVSPVASFSTVIASSPWTADTSFTFTGLSEGAPLFYRVRSRDGFDQRSSWSVLVNSTQDASSPQVPMLNPEPDFTAGLSNTITWLPSYDAGVGGVEYLLEAATDASFDDIVASTGWLPGTGYTFRMLGDGVTYHFRARARDAFGHETGWSARTSSTQDDSPPEVVFTPLPGVVSKAVVELSGDATDAGSGVGQVEVSTDLGATWREATYSAGKWTHTWTGYGSGTHEVWARATDALGNRMTVPAVLQVEVDLDAPEASITSPVVNETLTGLVPVQGTALDPHIADYSLHWTRNGVNLTPIVVDQRLSVVGGTLAIWDTRHLGDGEVQLVLEVNDTSGRTTRTNVTVILLNSKVEISPGDLLLSKPLPFKGDNITISATFRNSGTSTAKRVKVTIRDNGEVLYQGTMDIEAGEHVTVDVAYVVPDHHRLHTITATATYEDHPDPQGNAASVSFTGREVVVEPFFDTSEWTLFALIMVVLGVLVVLTLLTWRRIASAPAAPPPGLPITGAALDTFEPIGADRIAWDDDSF